MKKLTLFAACFAFVLASCHKALVVTPDSAGISAVINGKYETFNHLDSVRAIGTNGVYLTGSNDTTSDKVMLFVSSQNKAVAAGTYNTATAGGNGLQMLFGVGPGYTYDNYYYTYAIEDGPSYDATLTVTSADSTSIKGTFSGTVVLESSINSTGTRPTKTITDGKFSLNIKKTVQAP